MFQWLAETIDGMRVEMRALDVDTYTGTDAARLVELADELRRMADAVCTLAAGRVDRAAAFSREGFKDAAQWLAAKTGTSAGEAAETVRLAAQVRALPETEQALRLGRISQPQAAAVARGASADPASERSLLRVASTASLHGLRDAARKVEAAAIDERVRYERIRKSRYLRHWTDESGAFRLAASLTPDDGARVLAAIEPLRDRAFQDARRAGRQESPAAYAADGLVALAERAATTVRGDEGASRRASREARTPRIPRATIHVRVDHAALVRGHTTPGELCEIEGVGPVPVAAVERMTGDAILKVLVTKGVDVVAVAHAGRTIPAHVRTAVELRDPVCLVPGCEQRLGLEIDHRVPFARGGPTTLENLGRLCGWHHHLKTHEGFMWVREQDGVRWLPPERARGGADDHDLVLARAGP